MKTLLLKVCGCLLLVSGVACSRANTTAEPARAITCMACHGGNGMQTAPSMPLLAGQSSLYTAKQLRDFRSGDRSDPVMSPLAQALSDAEIDELAAYFESLDSRASAGE